MPPTQAIMDPEQVRRFAEELKRFNADLQDKLASLQARFAALSDTWQDEVDFFDAVFMGKGAEAVSQYLLKGKQVGIQGELRQNRWEQEGQKRSKVEIIADTVVFTGTPGETREPVNRGGAQAPSGTAAQDDFRDIDFGGDDIPF